MSTHGDGGKGSARRKEDVSKINDNWDRIFKKDKPMNEHKEEPQRSEDTEQSDEEWTCDVCGGPMYTQPHWDYGQCDDCGARQELESDY
jgi:rubrerythrin